MARGLNGLRGDCKKCRFIKKEREVTPDGTMKCIKCNQIKEINCFSTRTDTKTMRTACKNCRSDWNLSYYKKNKEHCNELKRAWVNRHPDLHKASCAKWAKNNRPKLNKRDSSRRALEINCQPSWLTPIHMAQIQEMYDVALAKSVQTGIAYEVDHIHPLRGNGFNGLHVPWNLQIMTSSENRAKSNKFPQNEAHLLWSCEQ
jgi:hypothetical protein